MNEIKKNYKEVCGNLKLLYVIHKYNKINKYQETSHKWLTDPKSSRACTIATRQLMEILKYFKCILRYKYLKTRHRTNNSGNRTNILYATKDINHNAIGLVELN